mgnify:CR=1 FL=1
MADINTLVNSSVPDAINKLIETEQKTQDIIKWCTGTYVKADKDQAFAKGKEYTSLVLANVAFYIDNCAKQFMNLMDAEFQQVDKLTSDMTNVLSRLQNIRTVAGQNEYKKLNDVKAQAAKYKMRRVKCTFYFS